MINCSCTECKYRSPFSKVCQAGKITLTDREVHTKDGYMMIWICDHYTPTGTLTELQKAFRRALQDDHSTDDAAQSADETKRD